MKTATTRNNTGMVYHNLGQWKRALDIYRQALPIGEEVGDRYGERVTRYNMARTFRAQGRLAEAVAELRRAVALSELVGSPHLDRFKRELADWTD